MPRTSRGAHLWLRKERINKTTGKRIANSQWFIVDASKRISTGCTAGEAGKAEEALARYISGKYAPERRVRDIELIDIADVLSIYDDDKRAGMSNKLQHDERIKRLALWWGGKTLSDVTGETCRAYAQWRVEEAYTRAQSLPTNPGKSKLATATERPATGGARRDLEDLRAAINHHSKEGLHRGVVGVWLPEKGAPRERWLTRSEAARLLWVCWRTKEVQTAHRGPRKGRQISTTKYPLRHIARFVLIGLYTGTRAAAIAAASPNRGDGRSYVDLEFGIFYRLASGKRATKKRQPPVPLPPNLLSHMRRWGRAQVADRKVEHFVTWNGMPIKSVKTGFARAARLAQLGTDVTPHTLRHTAATWLMQNGVPLWEAAGYLGMSPEMVEKTYGHHHPEHLKGASLGFRRK